MTSAEAKEIIKGAMPWCNADEVRAAWQYLVTTGEIWSMGYKISQMAACMLSAGTLERNAA